MDHTQREAEDRKQSCLCITRVLELSGESENRKKKNKKELMVSWNKFSITPH